MPMAGDCFAALAMTDYGSAQVQPPRANPRTMLRTLALSLAAALLPLSGAAADEPAKAPRQIGADASIVFPSDTTIRHWRADRERGLCVQARRGEGSYGLLTGL